MLVIFIEYFYIFSVVDDSYLLDDESDKPGSNSGSSGACSFNDFIYILMSQLLVL